MTDLHNNACPKCNGAMTQGFVPNFTEHGGRLSTHWVNGAPKKSFWFGTKLPDEAPIPIGAYRCNSCGFIEFYALEKFGVT